MKKIIVPFVFLLSVFFGQEKLHSQNLGPSDVEAVSSTVEAKLSNGILKEIKQVLDSSSTSLEKVNEIEATLSDFKFPKNTKLSVEEINNAIGCQTESDWGRSRMLEGRIFVVCTRFGWNQLVLAISNP